MTSTSMALKRMISLEGQLRESANTIMTVSYCPMYSLLKNYTILPAQMPKFRKLQMLTCLNLGTHYWQTSFEVIPNL